MSFGLLFAGQGTQHPQMLPWLDDDDALVQQMQAALGVSNWRGALRDSAWAVRNRNVQVLLTGVGLAAWAQIKHRLPTPVEVAGYSVGELAAFSAAGVFDANTALALAAARADAMDRCATQSPGGLLAVTGLGAQAIESLCAGTEVSVAIRIAADAVVLGGPKPALHAAETRATEQGAKCTPLTVEVASHTPSMQRAADEFGQVLQSRLLEPPTVGLFSNVGAERIHSAEQASRALSLQIARTVQWADCLEAIQARRVTCVLEVGPGSSLATMWNRRWPEIPARCADEFRSAQAVVDWVLRCASR
jgi:[acyl-carrier-protein] S-malonyltransferase